MTSENELHETIAAKGQLEKAISRMIVEDTTAAMAKSLGSFLDRMEAEEAARTVRYESIVKGVINDALAPLMDEFQFATDERKAIKQQVDELIVRLETDEARLDRKRERLDEHDRRLAAVEAALAARPSPQKAQATYDGVQRILDHLGLASDGTE
jgi:regulator of replication initiation timing